MKQNRSYQLEQKMKNSSPQKQIPQGWVSVIIDDICMVMKGRGLSRGHLDQHGKNKCILYGELFTTYNEVISSVKSRTDSSEGIPSRAGDILIPGSTTTVARDLAIASALDEENVLLGGDINILRKKNNYYDSKFLAYYLTHYKKDEMGKLGQGSTIVHLYGNSIKKIIVIIPKDIEEQQKIAEILGMVDEEIANTQEVIETTEKLKRGLMKQLLTLGIGHTKFKETELGEIPEEWEVIKLDDVAKRGTGHTPNKKIPEYYDGKIKWISLADSKKLDDGLIFETAKEISQAGIDHSSAVIHPAGSVLLSRDAGIGKSAIMAEDMAVSQHFIVWTCGDKINNWYLYHWLQLHKPVFENIASGSTIKTIGLPFFKALSIALPPIEEQEKIVIILKSLDQKIDLNKKLKTKRVQLKSGLMQDLLSGNVRVNI
jgi:type I restriction enzyme S subunit